MCDIINSIDICHIYHIKYVQTEMCRSPCSYLMGHILTVKQRPKPRRPRRSWKEPFSGTSGRAGGHVTHMEFGAWQTRPRCMKGIELWARAP